MGVRQVGGEPKAKIEDCVSLFSSNITAVADDMMQGFLSRLDSVRELLINDVELFTKLFLSHKSMVVSKEVVHFFGREC